MPPLLRRILIASFLLGGPWADAPAGEVAPARPVVIVGEESPPFEFTGSDGTPRGIVVEIWTLWAARAGVEIEYRILPWTEALAQVQKGEADIVAGMFRTPEREAAWDFSDPYYAYDAAIFFHKELGGIQGIEDIKGFRVGLMEGDASLDLLRRDHPEATFVTFPTWQALIEAALANEVRIFLADVPQARHYLAKLARRHDFIQARVPLRTGRLHGGVREGNAAMVALMNRGFATFRPEDVNAIVERWGGIAPAPPSAFPWTAFLAVVAALAVLMLIGNALLLRARVRQRTAELVASQESLRSASRLLETVFDAIPDMLLVQEGDHTLVRVNRAGQTFLERLDRKPEGVRCFELIDQEAPCVPCAAAETAATATPAFVEKYEPRTDTWFEVRAYPLFDETGKVVRIVEHLRDITEAKRSRERLKEAHDSLEQAVRERTSELEETNRQLQHEVEERKRTEAALRHEQQLFHDLVMLNPYAIFVTDPAGDVTLANPRIEALSGRPFTAGYNLFRDAQMIDPATAERIRALGPGACLRLPDHWYEFAPEREDAEAAEAREKDRAPICLRSAVFPVHGPDGALQHYVVMHEDVTEAKRLQEQLIQSERMAAVGTLAGGVAHEFNNINTTVLGFVTLSLEEAEPGSLLEENLERIAKAARRASGITRKLLAFAGGCGEERHAARLEAIVEETLLLVEDKFRNDGIDFVRDWTTTPVVHVDPAQIGQVVLNLLINARHAILGRPDKRIRLAVRHEDGVVVLEVADNGSGIPETNLRKIFTPFFSTKGEYAPPGDPGAIIRGTGLGLSVSRTITEEHGGSLTATSREGGGSTFRLALPVGTEASSRPAPAPPQPERRGPTQWRVLVVEDEEDVRDYLGIRLSRLGSRVESVDNGEAAIAALRENRFDLMVLDLHVPRKHGEAVLAALAALPKEHRPACLVITGHHEEGDEAACRAAGADSFLRKPFTTEAFFDAVERALAKHER